MPKLVDHDAYRKEMLERSLELFSQKGYASVTMREIAAELGVSTGTLYHYFPTKEGMLEQLFGHIMETNVKAYLARVEGVHTASERLSAIALFWKDHVSYYQSILLLAVDVYRNDRDGTSRKMFATFVDYYTAMMSERLAISMRESRSLFTHLLGLVTHALFTPDTLDFNGEVDFLEATLARIVPHASDQKVS